MISDDEIKRLWMLPVNEWRREDAANVLAEVERLRAENALQAKYLLIYEASDNLVIKNEERLVKEIAPLLEEYIRQCVNGGPRDCDICGRTRALLARLEE